MTTRDRLAAVLAERLNPRTGMSERAVDRLADALLPVVEQIAAERAAGELLAAAEACDHIGVPAQAVVFRARAAGLTDKDERKE